MTASYRLIDYSLRPAKFAERKMLCELFSRLRVFGALEHYRYVGFGSIWFSDCIVFHKALGICDMTSIERETDHAERFTFNKPYNGVDLKFGESGDVLPQLNWAGRSLVWLDYDDTLSPAILDDVRTLASRVTSGSAIAISVNTMGQEDNRNDDADPIKVENREQFFDLFGVDRTPPDLTSAELRGWTLSTTARRIIRGEIEDALIQVNSNRPAGQQLVFKQIAAFEYSDGAKMTTIVGVVVDEGQNGLFESCNFRQLSYFSEDDSCLRIKVPHLTPKEMRHLDRSLPAGNINDVDLGPVLKSDAESYAGLYRFMPTFASFEQ